LQLIDDIEILLPKLCDLIKQAGHATLVYYKKNNLSIITKTDDSPLTQADLAANQIIVSGLNALSDIPIISEETHQIDYAERKNWKQFWLVDPLDGTKEFIKGSDEFTVNIALIENEQPILGLVYAPVLGELYFGAIGFGANYQKEDTDVIKLPFLKAKTSDSTLRVVTSASHSDEKTNTFVEKLSGIFERSIVHISKGSSLKICLLATGQADIYPRMGPTCEWDIAAGHAVLRCAGGELYNLETKKPLAYNKNSLLNPHFIGCGFTIKNGALFLKRFSYSDVCA